MRTRHLIAFALISLGLISCMKRTTVGRLNDGNGANIIPPDYSDPTTPSPECPAGVSLALIPTLNPTYRVNEASSFIVTASGCKYGYLLSYENENKNFGSVTAFPGTVFNTSFPKTFTTSGSQVVSARVSVLNQSQSPVREFPISMSVIVNDALPLTCTSSNFVIPREAVGDYRYSFNLQPSRPAKIIEVTSSEPSFLVASPTLSSTLSSNLSGEVTVKNRNGNLNFKIQDANNVQATCSVVLRKDIFGITLDFNGDNILDDAALIRQSDGTYQLQISYTMYVGATKVNTVIPATGFLPGEFYEWMIAGDINRDNRPDLIFFRREGSPAVGKFKLALSRGGTVGGTDLSYDFSNLNGQWASDRLLEFPWLDLRSSPPRIVGMLQGQQYASRIVNNTVENPEALSFSMSLAANPGLVSVGGRTLVTFDVQGFGLCVLRRCSVNQNGQCGEPWTYVGGISGNYRSSSISFNIGPLQSRTLVEASCQAPDYTNQVRTLTIPVSAPNNPLPLPAYCQAGEVTGGEVSEVGNYRIHSFKTAGAGSLAVSRDCLVDLLVVAGGGGGGSGRAAGGGGAGGLSYLSSFKFPSAGSYPVTVGAGGAANANGGNSSLGNLVVATGGGKGGRGEGSGSYQGGAGGSGGGAGFKNSCAIGAGTAGQGNAGGCSRSGNWIAGGGGGGAAGVGGNGAGPGSPGNATGGAGGSGRAYDVSGATVYYAGGGGGYGQHSVGAGGAGGGGRGGKDGLAGAAGAANTGGGGGGGNGAGGSGVVILRYRVR